VIPKAIPIPNSKIKIGPSVGFKNHLVALITDRKIVFPKNATPKIIKTLFRVPLKIEAQKNPTKILAKIIAGSEI